MTDNYYGDKVLEKFVRVVSENKLVAKLFYQKWGILADELFNKITDSGLHGGVYSKKMSLDNLRISSRQVVLNIGPEIGLEAFLLAEKVSKVIVCDPDEDNLKLINEIAKNYILGNGEIAVNRMEFLSAGINNSRTGLLEQKIYKTIEKLKKHGMLTYYNVVSKDEIVDINLKVDLVFIHKILSTISRTDRCNTKKIFTDSIIGLMRKLNKGGVLSWTEPEFMFRQNSIDLRVLKKTVRIVKYSVINGCELFNQVIFYK